MCFLIDYIIILPSWLVCDCMDALQLKSHVFDNKLYVRKILIVFCAAGREFHDKASMWGNKNMRMPIIQTPNIHPCATIFSWTPVASFIRFYSTGIIHCVQQKTYMIYLMMRCGMVVKNNFGSWSKQVRFGVVAGKLCTHQPRGVNDGFLLACHKCPFHLDNLVRIV